MADMNERSGNSEPTPRSGFRSWRLQAMTTTLHPLRTVDQQSTRRRIRELTMKRNAPDHYGLLAIGRAGYFTVEILENSAAARLISIEADGWSFSFALGEHDPAEMLTHLRGQGTSPELKVGAFCGAPVMLIKDDEFSDRYFLRTFREGELLDFVFAADRLAQFTDALAQAVHDLGS
jgi:hypothetical protein